MSHRLIIQHPATLSIGDLNQWLHGIGGFDDNMLHPRQLAVGGISARLLVVPDGAPAQLITDLEGGVGAPAGVRVMRDRRMSPSSERTSPDPDARYAALLRRLKRAVDATQPTDAAVALIDTSYVGTAQVFGGMTEWFEVTDNGAAKLAAPPGALNGDHASGVAAISMSAGGTARLRSFKTGGWAWQASLVLEHLAASMPDVQIACVPMTVVDDSALEPSNEVELLDDVIDAVAEQLLVCAAAGNLRILIGSPGSAAQCVTVGAFEGVPAQADRVHPNSAIGHPEWSPTKPDMLCWWGPYDALNGAGGYMQLPGTSGAAAHFAGLISSWMRLGHLTVPAARTLIQNQSFYQTLLDASGIAIASYEQGRGVLDEIKVASTI